MIDLPGRTVMYLASGVTTIRTAGTVDLQGDVRMQRPRTSLGFDERDCLAFGHRLAAVLAVCSRQRRGELKPDDLAFNDGCRIHDTSERKEPDRRK